MNAFYDKNEFVAIDRNFKKEHSAVENEANAHAIILKRQEIFTLSLRSIEDSISSDDDSDSQNENDEQ